MAVMVEEYLRMPFEHDREYVRGEVVERAGPTFSHGNVQACLSGYFLPYRATRKLFGAPEVRLRLSEDVVRIPDFTLFAGVPEEVPDRPPILVVEITSPDDRLDDVMEKLKEYRAWGVPHVWLIHVSQKKLYVYEDALQTVDALEMPEYGVRLGIGEIFC
jgi:Uma2 family endonuclease